MEPKIAKVVVGLPVEGPFDYSIGTDLRGRIAVGHRVRILFNRQDRVGFVVGLTRQSAIEHLNPILALLDEGPVLDQKALELAEAFSDHYGCSLGEAIETSLPSALRQDKLATGSKAALSLPDGKGEEKTQTTLIHDQTTYKRWAVIIERIRKVVNERKNVIVLVPDMFFIDGTVAILTNGLNCPVIVLDRKLTPKKELAQWEAIRSAEGSVIIGTRSAVFAPCSRLGLIVIDEEDNSSYKQEQTPHYHAREVARLRSRTDRCDLLFTGSVPSAEIWEMARREKWETVTLETDETVKMQVIDMTNYNPRKTSVLSFPLQDAMRRTLESGGKAVLFMNRRGFSTRTRCQQCGFTVRCERCDINLSYMYSKRTMVCPHCNYKCEIPKICPQCQGSYLRSTGTGIEKLESELARLYPNARTHHYDRESKVFPQDADVIITTQAIFRRHERWTVPLVAMMNFDHQMHLIDFRSGNKAFSLLVHLTQLASGKVLVQTRMPDNYIIKAARAMDFRKFYREELKQRKELDLPPYKSLVGVVLRGRDEDVVFEQSKTLFGLFNEKKPKTITVSDPHPDVSPKLRDKYRFTILLKGKSVKSILTLVKKVLKGFRKKSVIITVNVDP